MAVLINPDNMENIKSIYYPQLDFLKKRKEEKVNIFKNVALMIVIM